MAAPWALTHREAMAIKRLAQALVAEEDIVEARRRPSAAESRSGDRELQMHPEHVIKGEIRRVATAPSLEALAKETGIEQAVRLINQDPLTFGLKAPIQMPDPRGPQFPEESRQPDQPT